MRLFNFSFKLFISKQFYKLDFLCEELFILLNLSWEYLLFLYFWKNSQTLQILLCNQRNLKKMLHWVRMKIKSFWLQNENIILGYFFLFVSANNIYYIFRNSFHNMKVSQPLCQKNKEVETWRRRWWSLLWSLQWISQNLK